MFRKTVTLALAGAIVFAPVAGAAPMPRAPMQAQATDQETADLNAALDSLVSQDSGSWWWYRYERRSMWGSRVIDMSSDRNILLVRGEFTYDGGTWGVDQPGWVRARITDGRLTCLSYDTSPSTNCEVYGGGESWFGGVWEAVATVFVETALRWLWSRISGHR